MFCEGIGVEISTSMEVYSLPTIWASNSLKFPYFLQN